MTYVKLINNKKNKLYKKKIHVKLTNNNLKKTIKELIKYTPKWALKKT